LPERAYRSRPCWSSGPRSGDVVAAVNVSIPWSPATMSELTGRLGPTVQATANEIAAR